MRVRSFTTSLLLVCGGCFFAESNGLAFAQEKSDKRAEIAAFGIADADSDGTVSSDELRAFLNEFYLDAWAQKVDANGNGEVSKREFRLVRKAIERILEEGSVADLVAQAVKKKKKPMGVVEQMNAIFMDQKPMVGSTIGDLVAYRENGEELNLNDLKGKHVVVVFGCLT